MRGEYQTIAMLRRMLEKAEGERDKALADKGVMAQALLLIATPVRADGSWNRSREVCEELARDTLDKVRPI